MKLLLVNPPIRDFYDTDVRLQPLGLAMLKAAVTKYVPKVQVTILDFHQGYGRRTLAVPPALTYLKKYYSVPDQSPFSSFHQFYHFGASFAEIARAAAEIQPDLIGISCLFTAYYQEALNCARAIKAKWPAPIIMGGHHVSAAPQSVLADPAVDYIICGEGERPLVEFLTARLNGRSGEEIANLGYKKAGRMHFNPIEPNLPLTDLPAPDLSDWPLERYQHAGQPLAMVVTSRGCPHGCAFCSVHQTFGRRYRRRSPELVVTEIEARFRQGFRVIDFEDDNLTLDQKHLQAILKGLLTCLPPGALTLTAMNGVSYHGLENDTLVLMKKAGFVNINLSLVSARGQTLDQVHRPHTVTEFETIVRWAQELGFNVVAYQIIGLPGENLSAMAGTMALLARLPVLIGASIFYFTPGCPMSAAFPTMEPDDMIRARSTAMAVETADFSRDDLATLFVTARILNFLKGLQAKGPVSPEETSLTEALAAAQAGVRRHQIGVEILNILLTERKLYAATSQGLVLREWFNPRLFFDVWDRIEVLATTNGGRIKLNS